MHKIQTLNKISPVGLERLPREKYEIATEINEPDGIILRSFKMHDMALPENLKVIGRAGAGVNNIPVDKCTENGIIVFNAPGANANAVKEITILGLLTSSRKIYDGVAYAKTLIGKGDDVTKIIEKNKSRFAGPEVLGKKLGVIGLGAIGALVANSGVSLGMQVEGYDPYISVEHAWGLSRAVKHAKGIDRLLATSDYISVHMPVVDSTKGFINAEKLAQMKDGVRIINFARGGIVNDKDMIEALKSGKVGCYVTDFVSEELLKMENAICIPHLGASTPEAEDNCAIMIADQVMDFLENGNITNSVNFPACAFERRGDARIILINKNVPNMVGQYSSVLADAKLNIVEMLNKSKGDNAYNIVDVKGEMTDEVLKKLRSIEGVIRTRIIKNS